MSPIYIAMFVVLVLATSIQDHKNSTDSMQGQEFSIPQINEPFTDHMVEVEGRSINAKTYGSGKPTVILISGLNAPQIYWNPIIPKLSKNATILTYDRPGIGISDNGHLPKDGGRSAEDLKILLDKLGLPDPYILVGHSYGASIARIYASRFPDRIGGIILEDGQHESILDEQLSLLNGEELNQFKRIIESMPVDEYSEIGSLKKTNNQLSQSPSLPRVPYVVISSGKRQNAFPPIFSEETQQEMIKLGLKNQEKLVELIPGGKHIVAKDSGHNIHLEKPKIIIKQIMAMIREI